MAAYLTLSIVSSWTIVWYSQLRVVIGKYLDLK